MYYFTDDYLIGVEQIDEEHRECFQLIVEIRELLQNDSIKNKHDMTCHIFERVKECAREHFCHEEEYMEKINHPELELQREQHLEFGRKMDEMNAKISEYDPQEFLNELLTYLVRWIYKHIIGFDLMIGKVISSDEWEKIGCDFTDEYLTGVELVDEEHKELFRIIGQVREIITDDLGTDKHDEIDRLIEELIIFTKSHFKDEEEYLTSIRYKGLEAHKAAHETLAARLDEIDVNGIDVHQKEEVEELMVFLTEWLVNHILQMDRKFSLTYENMT